MAPMITPDFSEAGGFAPGYYDARINKCEQKTSKSGNPYLNWTLEVTAESGQTFSVYYSTPFTGKGAGLFRNLVKAAFDPNYESGNINTDTLVGCDIQVRLEKETNQDGTVGKYLRVAEVNPIEGRFEQSASGF